MRTAAFVIYLMIGLGVGIGAPEKLCGKPIEMGTKIIMGVLWPVLIGGLLAEQGKSSPNLEWSEVC